ncbi:MAG: heparinase [Phycisphaerae bacterium]|nr:heparinase [Phycisphaerae bacterium]
MKCVRRAVVLVGPWMMIAGVWGAEAASNPAPAAERVRAIATMLPERPVGMGQPISDRKAWAALAQHAAYAKVVAAAEKSLDTPLPDLPDELYLDYSRTGNRRRYERVYGERNARLTPLVLAECIENRGRFLPAIAALVEALAAQPTWILPAHDRNQTNFEGKAVDVDLVSSAQAWHLATAHYLLGDKLDERTRSLIRENIDRRVLDPYRDMVAGKRQANWWLTTHNNWNSVCLAGVTGAAMAMVPAAEDRAFFVAAAEKYALNFLKGFTPDGYCSEGVGYWNYGFGNYLYLAEIIHQATGGKVDLLADEAVRAAATYGARIEIADGVVPAFADCSLSARPSGPIMYFVSRRLGLGIRQWDNLDPVTTSGGLGHAMLYSFPTSASRTAPASVADAGPGLRSWFDHAGVLIARPAPDSTCRLAVALKGGHNAEHHNHNDVGSFVAVVDRTPVLLDPGLEVYTARTFSAKRYESKMLNSFGHPVPLIAGKLQRAGTAARGEVLRTEFTDEADTLALDIRSAYPVPELEKLERTFVYDRRGTGALTITDVAALSAPQTFETALITFGQWRELEPGVLLVTDDKASVRVTIDTGGEAFEIHPEKIEEDLGGRSPPTRIGIRLARPLTQVAVRMTVTPAER